MKQRKLNITLAKQILAGTLDLSDCIEEPASTEITE